MSSGGVAHCLHHALEIGREPRSTWADLIARLPERCTHTGSCSGTEGCRQRIADYLRVQYQAQARRERIQAGDDR